ncbi:MAG: serine/threonine protein kinase [Rhizobiales bacterium]|nr:serine/threonine protein kinase [Rhizobacter sp.]
MEQSAKGALDHEGGVSSLVAHGPLIMDIAVKDPQYLRQLNVLLEQALSLPDEDRDAWLQSLPPADRRFVVPLSAMLARMALGSDEFMRRPVDDLLDGFADLDSAPDTAGDEIGPYRLLRKLGSGGMAAVWLASRGDGSPRRQLALKLPLQGWAPGLSRRMARERDILAALEHPHIARLYDAGVTPSGRPWLAMEYVDGQPIDLHCRHARMGVRETLQLFLQVTEAVAYAHERLIVHRDLKPGNILVTPQGSVRLLDFGVAGLLADNGSEDGRLTQAVGRAFTRAYASPEQIRGETLTVGTDVYSLGVVLYELLAGEPPYKLRHESAAALEEAILRAEVKPASQTATRGFARELRGDIDNVLAKAMKKDQSDRYANVDAFANDLRRVLQRRPVSARRDSLGYRLTRFVQRNTLPVAAGTAVALAVLGGAGASMWQAREAQTERDRALQRLARNEEVSEFLELMFTQAVPAGQGEVVQQLLDRSAGFAGKGTGEPEHRAAVLLMLATLHLNMAEPAKASPLLEQANALVRSSRDNDLRAQIACASAQSLGLAGRGQQALEALEPWLNASHIDHNVAAACLLRRSERAAASYDAAGMLRFAQAASDRLQRARSPSLPLKAVLLGQLAGALQLNGRGAEADVIFQQALDAFSAIGREQTADAAILRGNWASTRISAGDVLPGLKLCEEAMQTQAQHTGKLPSTPLLANCALGSELLGRNEEALTRYRSVLEASTAAGDVQSKVFALCGKAAVHLQMGELERAREALDQARTVIRSADFPPHHAAALRHSLVRARLDTEAGQPQAARQELDGVIKVFIARQSHGGPLAAAYRLRADAMRATGDLMAAAADARSAIKIAESAQAGRSHSFQTGMAWLALADVQHAARDPSSASQSAREALAHLQAAAGPQHPAIARTMRLASGS